jgi:hypothetical protein
MTLLQKQSLLFRACKAVVNGAVLLVPESLRTDWKKEWLAEISCKLGVQRTWSRADTVTQAKLLRRTLGAFTDAVVLRWDFLLSPPQTVPRAPLSRQPLFLGLAIFTLLTLAVHIARPWILSQYGLRSREYFYCYWATDIISVFALFGIIFLLYRCALLGATRIWGGVQLILGGVFFVTCVLSCVQQWHFGWPSFFLWLIGFKQSLFLSCILLTALLVFAVRRVDSAEDLTLPVCGMVILLTPYVAILISLKFSRYPGGLWGIYNWVSNGSLILAFMVWGYAYARARRRPNAPLMTK